MNTIAQLRGDCACFQVGSGPAVTGHSLPEMAADTAFVHLFAGIPTADYDRALPWYERLMGRPPDIVPTAGEAMWTATGTGSIYLVTDPGRAGGGTVTLAVSDLDALLAELAGRGIEPAAVETMAAGRKATVIDAEGNWIAFVELVAGG
jgi:predicted enzyme related to lactoylglutathione lyase